MFSWICWQDPDAWSTPSAAMSSWVQPAKRPVFSASGTSSGLTSYAETQVAPARTGSGASWTARLVILAATRATVTAVSAMVTASDSVSATPEAKPHAPSRITRTAKPRSSASWAPSSTPSRTEKCW